MEFDETLCVLQGTICSLGSQGLLNNKDAVQDAVEALKNTTKNVSDDAKSKIVFFMVLNTDLSVCEELRDDEFVGLLANITPPIRIDYLITYAYHLDMQAELCKIIENTPGRLSLEVLDAIMKKLENPSFHRDEFGSKHFYQLWQSIFVKVCKISTGLHSNDDAQKFVSYFGHMHDLIQKIIITTAKIRGLESISGLHLYYFFQAILFCFKLHKNPHLTDDPLYKMNVEFQNKGNTRIKDPPNACIALIFNKVDTVLENVTLDLWMSLSECYFDFDKGSSIQMLIGSTVQSILEETKDCGVPSQILSSLSHLAIDKFSVAGIDDIISNVKNGQKEWFQALLSHPAVMEKEAIKCLTDNLSLSSSDDLDRILNITYEHICNVKESEGLESIKDLFLSAVSKSSNHQAWLEKVFQNYKPNLFITPHTQSDLTQTFNKVSKNNYVSPSELVSLYIQSPVETLNKLSHLAIYGSTPVEEVTQLLKMLQHPCTALQSAGTPFLHHVLLNLLSEELRDREKLSLINLIGHLGKESLLGPSFATDLVEALRVYLEKAHLERAVLCLEVVKGLLERRSFVVDYVVFLVFLSQVLEYLSWDLERFSSVKAEGRDVIICISKKILDGLEGKADGARIHWARKEVLKSSEINRVCFSALWLNFGLTWTDSTNLHSSILTLAHSHQQLHHLNNFFINLSHPLQTRPSFVLSLIMLLPVLTFREWNSLFDGLIKLLQNYNHSGEDDGQDDLYFHVLDIFRCALYFLALHLVTAQTAFPCFEYCLRNFARLLQKTFSKITPPCLAQTFQNIFFLLTAIEDKHLAKPCWMILSPVLLELLDSMKQQSVLDSHRTHIHNLLPLLDLKDIAEAFAKRLG